MKLNELRTAVKEAGIRPVDTAHVAEGFDFTNLEGWIQ